MVADRRVEGAPWPAACAPRSHAWRPGRAARRDNAASRPRRGGRDNGARRVAGPRSSLRGLSSCHPWPGCRRSGRSGRSDGRSGPSVSGATRPAGRRLRRRHTPGSGNGAIRPGPAPGRPGPSDRRRQFLDARERPELGLPGIRQRELSERIWCRRAVPPHSEVLGAGLDVGSSAGTRRQRDRSPRAPSTMPLSAAAALARERGNRTRGMHGGGSLPWKIDRHP